MRLAIGLLLRPKASQACAGDFCDHRFAHARTVVAGSPRFRLGNGSDYAYDAWAPRVSRWSGLATATPVIAMLLRVTEPRRVLIDWDYGANGIWWVLSKEEMEAPGFPAGGAGRGRLSRATSRGPEVIACLLDYLMTWRAGTAPANRRGGYRGVAETRSRTGAAGARGAGNGWVGSALPTGRKDPVVNPPGAGPSVRGNKTCWATLRVSLGRDRSLSAVSC